MSRGTGLGVTHGSCLLSLYIPVPRPPSPGIKWVLNACLLRGTRQRGPSMWVHPASGGSQCHPSTKPHP